MKHKKKAVRFTKASFVRSYPKSSAETIVALAQERGLDITAKYVKSVRYDDSRAKDRKEDESEIRLRKKHKEVVQDLEELKMGMQNPKAAREVVDRLSSPDGARVASGILAVSGEGLVKAFKALVVSIGTRVSRQLIEQVEDETAKLFGRPPM